MHKFIKTLAVSRKLKHYDLEHEIYDEEFKKEITWLFGIFKHSHTFNLTNDMSSLPSSKTSGFNRS